MSNTANLAKRVRDINDGVLTKKHKPKKRNSVDLSKMIRSSADLEDLDVDFDSEDI